LQKVLYISIDGMTDPLGQSQVLPYIQGLSKKGYQFTLLSLEKRERFEKGRAVIEAICKESNIFWVPLRYYTTPRLIAKSYNRMQLFSTAKRLYAKNQFALTHCRGYASGEVGMYLKKHFQVPYIFDMRGFWPDEKKDSSQWPQEKWIYRKIYQHYKKQEKLLLQSTNHIISLTYAGQREMETWEYFDPAVPVSVIPCCADMEHFSLTDKAQKKDSRTALNIPENAFVVSYLGSIGSWYMLDEMLQFYKIIKEKYRSALFFLVTPCEPDIIIAKAKQIGIAAHDILIKEATRAQVPMFMKASDITLSFIRPSYSKISSSPTKLGEVMAMGIPVVTNGDIGDVEEIVTDRGLVLQKMNTLSFQKATQSIATLLNISPIDIRSRAIEWFDLKKGVEQYKRVYAAILSTRSSKITIGKRGHENNK
jgi:glycosyltransferase involved in cell wall biosynthesis